MKSVITLCILFASVGAFCQIDKNRIKKAAPIELKSAKITEVTANRQNVDITGQYEITKYSQISKKTIPAKELKLLIGTLVKVNDTAITGSEIDPFNFEIFEITKMNSSDYIFRQFEKILKSPEPNLPETVRIHKTDNDDCYGIVQINSSKIAIPYNGVLLFLTRK